MEAGVWTQIKDIMAPNNVLLGHIRDKQRRKGHFPTLSPTTRWALKRSQQKTVTSARPSKRSEMKHVCSFLGLVWRHQRSGGDGIVGYTLDPSRNTWSWDIDRMGRFCLRRSGESEKSCLNGIRKWSQGSDDLGRSVCKELEISH